MKKLPTSALLFALAVLAFASVTPVRADQDIKSFPAGGAGDMIQNTTPIFDTRESGGAIVKKADCRLNNGRIVKAEDPDYAKCTEMKGATSTAKGLEKKAKKGDH